MPSADTESPVEVPIANDAGDRAASTSATAQRRGEVSLHGHRVTYRTAGSGPLVVLIHGIAGSSGQWAEVMDLLAEHYTVLAPDMLGHGESAKPRGDYSLGAYAVSVRDLLIALGHRRATVVGHSLGGGVAMQFSYEYPVFCERLVLVSSGGLGRRVHPLLLAATLPGAEVVLPLIAHARVLGLGGALGSFLVRAGLRAGPDIAEMARGYASLADAEARAAFLQTVRAVIDHNGQRVSAADRLYLSSMIPALIVWGRRDPLIPAAHGEFAHGEMPGSRLDIFEEAGHSPHLDEPARFAAALRDFMEETDPAEFDFSDEDLASLRERILEHSAGVSGAGD